jgi:hypothetical protein
LYAVGGAGGGLALYLDRGRLVYEYNMMVIARTLVRAEKAPRGRQAHDRGRDHHRDARGAGRR